MKSEIKRDINHYFNLDGSSKITPTNLPIESKEFEPDDGEVIIDANKSGLRVKWSGGSQNTIVEEKINGEWVLVSGIQKLVIEFDVNSCLPIVKMERIIYESKN